MRRAVAQIEPTAPGRLASRIGRHTFVYALASGSSLVAGLVNVVVLTRYLTPADFGHLAVLLVTQSLLMLIFSAGSLQGAFSVVYGSTGGDDDVGDDAGPDGVVSGDRRRALTTGLALIAAEGLLGTLVIWAVSRPAARLLLGDPNDSEILVLTAVGAAVAAVWRLACNTLRLERRPWSYLLATATQHLLGLAFAIPLLVAGEGIRGVVGGIAGGNVAALGIALWSIRASLRPAASVRDARQIVRRGRALVPVVASVHLIQLADVLILAHFVPSAQVGLYRIANRFGALVTYWTSSFQMAWGSLRHDAAQVAAEGQHGRPRVMSMIATAFVLITVGVVLAGTVFADQLVRLAAPEFAAASNLIPLTAGGFAAHGLYVLAYRTADFPGRRRWFVGLSVLSAAAFAGSAFAWIPLAGAAGAALAVITGWGVGTIAMVSKGQLGPNPVPYEWRRMSAACIVAAGCAAGDRLGRPGWPGLVVDVLALAAYPALLVVLRVIPRGQVRALASLLRAGSLSRSPHVRLAEIDPQDGALIDLMLRRRTNNATVAAATGVPEASLHRRLVAAVRTASALGTPQQWDAELGRHLLLEAPFAEREASARALYSAGADPIEVEAIVAAANRLRNAGAPRMRWRAGRATRPT